jgi:DNA gyrase subunit A
VRLQKLDAGDRLTEVVLVPPAAEGEEEATVPIAEATPGPSAGQPAEETAGGPEA